MVDFLWNVPDIVVDLPLDKVGGDFTSEKAFESSICDYLAKHGWLYSNNDDGYDANRALFPQDIFTWLSDSQPNKWAAAIKPGTTSETGNKRALLDAIVKQRDIALEHGGGTLSTLRGTVGFAGKRFDMCQFEPPNTINEGLVKAYQQTRLRVMRQVHYNPHNSRPSIDLVLFVNGLPVATVELKTDFKQTIKDAIKQYKEDRNPAGQPLLEFGKGAVVHFAVSDTEVWMTTKLAGTKTRFLPFNKGNKGGQGNPIDGDGEPTAYLWEQILAPEMWMRILGTYLFSSKKVETDPITGKTKTSTNIFFPRYHQLRAVTRVLDDVKTHGVGAKYLIEHSAGSGKTNTIGWLAHRLARTYGDDNKKVFDTVLVLTDRTVLDDQLQRAVKQIDSSDETVVFNVDKKAISEYGNSKSKALLYALQSKQLIVVVTIQTFPAILEIIEDRKNHLINNRFAIIVDEAHSSQSGSTAKKVREALSAGDVEVPDGETVDGQDIVNNALDDPAAKTVNDHISYFAFTATPKNKTLEIFGTRDTEGMPHPFDLYSMKQAIQEGFILDVLPNYQTYSTAWRIAETASEREVDSSRAASAIKRYVRLHPTNIAQKVEIIVEHFRANVAPLLAGHAKAMIVTSERKAALRYKVEIDKYIEKHGYGIGTLVAFSGSLADPEYGFNEPVTENGANPGVKGYLAEVFAGPHYRVMIAADKFQTGFDQPLLCAMYVDKRLDGIQAVQTLSRLNRTYVAPSGEVKDKVFILDFVNDPETIRDAFKTYYEGAWIETCSDHGAIYPLEAKLLVEHIVTKADAAGFAKLRSSGQVNRSQVSKAMMPARTRFKDRLETATALEDAKAKQTELDALAVFKKNCETYVKLYDFLSQVAPYDVETDNMAEFLRHYVRIISVADETEQPDLSDINLAAIKQTATGMHNLSVHTKGDPLPPVTGQGGVGGRDRKRELLDEIIRRMNDLFGTDLAESAAAIEAFVHGVDPLIADPIVQGRAKENSLDQFLSSGKMNDQVILALLNDKAAREKLTAAAIAGDSKAAKIIDYLKEYIYRSIEGE
jgi:type I restriction enzyme R subunit